MMSLQVASDICELFKLCSTKQLEAARDFLSKVDRSSKKKQDHHGDKCENKVDSDDKKSSVTMAIEQLSINDKSLTTNDQCSGHHGNSKSTYTLGMNNETEETSVTNSDDNDGWEVVKKKKR